jgi:diacylglycerol kinase family enzyme
MYYYIFDVKRCKKRATIETIKSALLELGISGEYNYISNAQTAEQLVELGLNRGYSTIVGIGGDDLINSIANCMVGRKEAMGAIPMEISDSMRALLGLDSWREACEALRFRRIKEMYIGRAANGEHFLTEVYINTIKPVQLTIEFKNFIIQVLAKNFMVSNYHQGIKKIGADYLDVVIESQPPESNSIIDKFKSMFNPQVGTDAKAVSLLHARSMRIFSKKPTPLTAGGKIIARTPQLIESSDEMLRLIVSRKH